MALVPERNDWPIEVWDGGGVVGDDGGDDERHGIKSLRLILSNDSIRTAAELGNGLVDIAYRKVIL